MGVFGPFKMHWKRVCHDFQVSHPGQVVNYYNFCSLFSKAWVESMTCINILAGFKTTGVYPVNRDAIQLPGEPKSTEGMMAPQPMFTPFKRAPEVDGLYTSADIPTQPRVDLLKRPVCNLLTNQQTPKLKTQRIRPVSDMVITSSEFRSKKGTTKADKVEKGSKGSRSPVKSELKDVFF